MFEHIRNSLKAEVKEGIEVKEGVEVNEVERQVDKEEALLQNPETTKQPTAETTTEGNVDEQSTKDEAQSPEEVFLNEPLDRVQTPTTSNVGGDSACNRNGVENLFFQLAGVFSPGTTPTVALPCSDYGSKNGATTTTKAETTTPVLVESTAQSSGQAAASKDEKDIETAQSLGGQEGVAPQLQQDGKMEENKGNNVICLAHDITTGKSRTNSTKKPSGVVYLSHNMTFDDEEDSVPLVHDKTSSSDEGRSTANSTGSSKQSSSEGDGSSESYSLTTNEDDELRDVWRGMKIEVGEEKKGLVVIPQDTYSMIYLAPWNSSAIWYAFVVFGLQMTFLVLAFVDSIGNDPSAATDGQVLAARYIALLVSVLAQKDVTQSLLFIQIGLGSKEMSDHQSMLQERYSKTAATSGQYWFSNLLRLTKGLLCILVSFLFIIQSNNVLEIFMNFAAIYFVSELDTIGFRLLREGWLGIYLQSLARSMSGETLPPFKPKGFMYQFNRILLVVAVLTLFACNFVVASRQSNGYYIKLNHCSVLDVHFGEEVYDFPKGNVHFKSHEVKGTEFYKNSTRAVHPSFDLANPPDLHYAYFSGTYYADFDNKAGIPNERPVYYEGKQLGGVKANKNESPYDPDDYTLGFFYYCEVETAWVWTVRALLEAGAVPSETVDRCKYGWLLRSPITDAVTLEDAPSEHWDVWTGVLGEASELSISCLECKTNIDCGLNRGICGEDSVCHCNEGAVGDFCNEDLPCMDLRGDFLDEQVAYHILSELHGRPIYFRFTEDNGVVFIFYSGSRWISYEANSEEAEVLDLSGIRVDLHAYWFAAALTGELWYSEQTHNFLPTGPLQWYEESDTRSKGNSGSFGREIEVDYAVECLSVNCDSSSHVCGQYGTCKENQTLTIQGNPFLYAWSNETILGGKCVCENGYHGQLCEFTELEVPP